MTDRIRCASNSNFSDFACLCCGTCCSRYQARVELSEIDEIAQNLGISNEQFIQQYTDPRWPGTRSFLIRHVDSVCIFLKPSEDGQVRLCSIHAFKPACCLEWQAQADRSECQEGLNRRGNVIP